MKNIAILGSSGSIGTQALNLISKTKKEFKVCGLSVHSNIDLLKKQITKFKPSVVSVFDKGNVDKLQKWCNEKKLKVKVFCGKEGLNKVATIKSADMVLSSVVGSIGLEPLLAAIESGKDVAIANKEALVIPSQRS